ncbi:MAG: PQQ-dependent sugar dehydrogenase [Pseudomonadota bacterium]|nr:PQQ-dependent sugar dehydrogenase [Pseudomonadota bacterium]
MRLELEEIIQVDGVVWGIDFINPKTMIFTVRRGETLLLDLKTKKTTPLSGSPIVHRVMGGGPFDSVASGGLFDVLVDKSFKENKFLYFAYVKKTKRGHALAVAKGRLEKNQIQDLQDIFIANNDSEEAGRWGTRLEMDAKGFLYIAVGDRRIGDNAQDLNNHLGKIIRLHSDGAVPIDNPFFGKDNVAPEIWSYGHRNPQGLAIQPKTGELFEHEHGPDGGDEINVIEAGKNYGWPIISYGMSRTGAQIGTRAKLPGLIQPISYYEPGIAPSGMSFYDGNYFKGWSGNLFIGSLNRMRLNRIAIKGREILEEEQLLSNWGERIRDVTEGLDGFIYLATGSGKIARIQIQAG